MDVGSGQARNPWCAMLDSLDIPTDHRPVWTAATASRGIDVLFDAARHQPHARRVDLAQAQPRSGIRHPGLRLAVACLGAAAGIVALCGIAITLYVVKSAMGIDLFAGHSALHDWFYVR
ncbi:MAG: hypothetical protein AAFR55_05100 [Pseudomonadota bacterium]